MLYDEEGKIRSYQRILAGIAVLHAQQEQERVTTLRHQESTRRAAWRMWENFQEQRRRGEPTWEETMEEREREKRVLAIKKANPNTNPIGLGTSFERLIPPTDPAFRESRPHIPLKESFKEFWKQLFE